MHVTDPKTIKAGAPVLFLQHGLFSSAEWWIMNAEQSPAFILARAGYDIWLGNNRGTRYARKNNHINPDTQASQFFDYSWFELGQYDGPA